MRKKNGLVDCSDLAHQIEEGLNTIDAELGLVAFKATVAGPAEALKASTRAVTKAAHELTDSKLVRLYTAEERARWHQFAQLPPMRFFLDKLGPKQSDALATVMSKWVGFPTLLSQATTLRKLCVTTSIASSGLAYVLSTDLGRAMVANCEGLLDLAPSEAHTVTGITMVMAAYAVSTLLKTAVCFRAHARHDEIARRAQEWNDKLDRGWRDVLPRLLTLGLQKVISPYPAYDESALQKIRAAAEGGLLKGLSKTELAPLQAVRTHLVQHYGVDEMQAPAVAINLLAHEESNPNRLLSTLHTRSLPADWISKYQIDPRYCVLSSDAPAAPAADAIPQEMSR